MARKLQADEWLFAGTVALALFGVIMVFSASALVATVTCRRMTIRVGVFGAAGRMGSMVCQTVADDLSAPAV